MKSVMAVETRNERRGSLRLRLFTFGVGLSSLALLLLAGCATRQPGLTAAEVHRQHKRAVNLDLQMMMQDIDHALLLERPSMLTDRRVP